MANKLLEVKNVTKMFLDTVVVDDLSFKIRGGETFGLIGPNGAGKTTMMRMIMNIILPDEGEILYEGEARKKLKNLHFGYLPEERGLYPRITVLELLVYFGTLNNLSARKAQVEAIRLLDRLGLVEFADSRINQLSKGMQQKVQFIAAILHDPDVLILDEPFTGLDPINQIVLREILQEFRSKNKILVISTHQMEQAEKLCDHICLINQGRVILDGKLSTIKKQQREDAYYIESDDALAFLKEISGLRVLEEDNRSAKFSVGKNYKTMAPLITQIEKKARIKKFEVVEPSLHDIFIRLIQKQSGERI